MPCELSHHNDVWTGLTECLGTLLLHHALQPLAQDLVDALARRLALLHQARIRGMRGDGKVNKLSGRQRMPQRAIA